MEILSRSVEILSRPKKKTSSNIETSVEILSHARQKEENNATAFYCKAVNNFQKKKKSCLNSDSTSQRGCDIKDTTPLA